MRCVMSDAVNLVEFTDTHGHTRLINPRKIDNIKIAVLPDGREEVTIETEEVVIEAANGYDHVKRKLAHAGVVFS